jgi:hypothetical protein
MFKLSDPGISTLSIDRAIFPVSFFCILVIAFGCGEDTLTEIPTTDGSDLFDDGSSDFSETGLLDELSLDLEACTIGLERIITPEEGAEISFQASELLTFSISVPPNSVDEEVSLFLQCVDTNLVQADEAYDPLSVGLLFEIPVELSRYARVTIPFNASQLPTNSNPGAIALYFDPTGPILPHSAIGIDLQENLGRGYVTFSTRHSGTYQVVLPENAGEVYERNWQYRAITGVSMGCSGAMMVGLRNPDVFDIIGALGGPTDWTYMMHYIREGALGGVGPAPDFLDLGPMEPTEEMEHGQSFDDFWYPTGEGSGGTFDRSSYLEIFQDLALAFGNITNYSTDSPYLPPGVPAEELLLDPDERCPGANGETLTIQTGFYDDEYNPDGLFPVIMFCDGTPTNDTTLPFERYCDLNGDGQPDQANRGYYSDGESQNTPVEIAWAVDLNGNGQRDRGEPVIRNSYEPFEDTGGDALWSPDEPGYDPQSNRDPNGDDYDYYLNPGGSEENWLWDENEPFEDVGLDGVPDTVQINEGGFDYGEGNEQFDYNPHLEQLLTERDPHHLVGHIDENTWDSLSIYMDAGIRDLFNFSVSTNQFAGALQHAGQSVRIYNGFFSLANLDPEFDSYLFADIDYNELGDHVYLRYGDQDASEEEICLGDGKHVGTVSQIANRLLTLLGYITTRFPEGDMSILEPPYPTPSGNYRFYSEALGAYEQYSIILPPGYEWSACSDGEDNDEDGLTDGDDPDCEFGTDNDEGPGLGPSLCNDGIDNDGDGLVDASEDLDCLTDDDSSEWPMDHPMRSGRFPVVYLLHGYGQTPDELRATVVPFAGFMAGGIWQKVIIVYPDGYCGENVVTQCNDGMDNDEDLLIDNEDPDCTENGGFGETPLAPPPMR